MLFKTLYILSLTLFISGNSAFGQEDILPLESIEKTAYCKFKLSAIEFDSEERISGIVQIEEKGSLTCTLNLKKKGQVLLVPIGRIITLKIQSEGFHTCLVEVDTRHVDSEEFVELKNKELEVNKISLHAVFMNKDDLVFLTPRYKWRWNAGINEFLLDYEHSSIMQNQYESLITENLSSFNN